MSEFLCRSRNILTAGSIVSIEAVIKLTNGLFTIEMPKECEGCPARKGPVRIEGGDVIKNESDDWRVSLGLAKLKDVEKLNIVSRCVRI